MTEVAINRNLQSENNRIAGENREIFRQKGILCLNVLGSPGAGKTALLETLTVALLDRYRVAVIEGDMATTNDRDRIARLGIQAVQVTTPQYKSSCHMNAYMVQDVLSEFDLDDLDILIIENVGNLVCPAEFDLGEDRRLVVLSITEGEDKPLKYPVMFNRADAVAVNKMDLQSALGADLALIEQNIRSCNPSALIFRSSARAGDGFEEMKEWIADALAAKRGSKKK